ncbi:MAG TPA: hypothetical protein VMB03_24340 [Bryobacteraceae bacterium]|nr:hypothetical protein [Bryobacteraceae bacterium]
MATMNLALVHGRSQSGKDEEELRYYWIGCLERGFHAAGLRLPEDVQVTFPFYADALERIVRAVDSPVLANVLSRGGDATETTDKIRIDILQDFLGAQTISEKQVLSHLDNPSDRGLQNSQLILAMLRSLDRIGGGSPIIDALTRDVSIYLGMGGVQRQINDIVGSAIKDVPTIVVAHSLGSIIAYNVLAERASRLPGIPLFITVGSPLGIRAIATRLRQGTKMPDGVSRWLNARDPHDVVALHPITFSAGDQAYLENYSLVENFTANHHGIEGYLTDRTVVSRLDAAFRASYLSQASPTGAIEGDKH